MGEWDEFCTICAGPPYVEFDAMDTVEGEPLPPPQPNPADYTWLESFIGISNKEELIPLEPYNGYGGFDIQADTSPYSYFYVGRHDQDYLDTKVARGYACHVACYNLLQQELNYTLKYADLLPLVIDNENDCNKFSWSDYGGLAEYQDNQGLYDAYLVKDGKVWMVADPSRNEQNKERILQLWRPLVESGFKRPDATVVDSCGQSGTVGNESLAPEIATLNLDESKA